MIEVVDTLNTFASNEAAQPSEQVFVLTSNQLEAIIQRVIAPLMSRIEVLEVRQNAHSDQNSLLDRESCAEKEIRTLNVKLEALEELIPRVDALSKKIARLEGQNIQPMQKDRSEILKALILREGGKMLMKDAKRIMHLSDSRISELVSKMESSIEVRISNLDKRQKILVLK